MNIFDTRGSAKEKYHKPLTEHIGNTIRTLAEYIYSRNDRRKNNVSRQVSSAVKQLCICITIYK